MKSFIKAALLAGLCFGFVMGLIASLQYGLVFGIISGCITGLLFGLILFVFVSRQSRKFNSNKEITGGEDIIYEGGANHFVGKQSVGGWLYLTKDKLIFKSHKYNISKHEKEILLDQILKADTYRSLGIVPNGLEITSKEDNDKFVVFGRDIWVKKINDAIAEYKGMENR